MGPEEKAKYTTRAREVWDKYLSSAPARAPKPRRQVKLPLKGFLYLMIKLITLRMFNIFDFL